jgi:serine/threonine protein kinase
MVSAMPYAYGRLDRYDVLDRLALGGSAELYRARDKKTGGLVCIKRLRSDLGFDPAVSAGFLREIQLAFASEHKNLIRALDRGTFDGADWVAVELIEGRDLATLIERARARGERVSLPLSLFIVREILDGLAFAYNILDATGMPMGLVHRDLNPRNVLIGYDGGVRVADFGASVASLSEPVPDEVVGSPGYLSPEQASLSDLDARSDIFAVGCILYELVAGTPAFDVVGKRELQQLKLHQKGQIKKVPRDVPDAVRFIIEIACAPDREDRYLSAAQMRDAIDEILEESGERDLSARLGGLMRELFPEAARA